MHCTQELNPSIFRYDSKFYWLIAACVLVTLFEVFALGNIRLPPSIDAPFFLLLIFGIGYKTLWHGLKALIALDFRSINALMLIAVLGAFYLGKYEEAAVVIVLYTLAEKLEDIGIQKSQFAMKALIEKMPKTVLLKGWNDPIPLDSVQIDDIMILKPGDLIGLDGIVILGTSYVDESMITGELLAKDKSLGDEVYAGTLNKQGYLEVKVIKTSRDTTFSKIKELTLEATQFKAKTQKFIESFSLIYTPIIIALALSLVLIPTLLFQQPFDHWLLQGLALLVIACPCALVISAPVSIYSALGNASKQGALIKGGRFLEELGQVKAIALDKTRTLTFGEPYVTDIIPFGNYTKEELLACIAGVEMLSEHPIAKSIVEKAKTEKIIPHAVEKFESFTGKGTKAECLVCQDKHRCIGKLSFVLEEHHVPSEIIALVERLQNEGKTSIVISNHREVEGVVAVADVIRPDSKKLIDEIKKLGIVPVMLTGDHIAPATAVANEVGIDQIKAELLPEDKAFAIEHLIKRYGTVAMVGDGVNDAPALALSNVGISMCSLGSDTALEAASIILLNDRLEVIPCLIRLGRRTIRTIQFNTALAISIKLIFIILALLGLSHLALAIFADVGVTLIVILISLRLLKT